MSGIKTIGVLGCGWLGAPLAEKLIADGYTVKGTVTSEDKKQILKDKIEDLYVLQVGEDKITGATSFFFDLDVLVLAMPPRLRGPQPQSFVAKMKHILIESKINQVKHILYIGTTAVFPNDDKEYSEESELVPFDVKSKELIIVESLLMKSEIPTTIVRMGGLVGDSRHPVSMLSKKSSIKNPDAPVNLIHQIDAIGIVSTVIKQNHWGYICHGIAPLVATKKEYYSSVSRKKGLKLQFDTTSKSVGKRVQSDITNNRLSYSYQNIDCQ